MKYEFHANECIVDKKVIFHGFWKKALVDWKVKGALLFPFYGIVFYLQKDGLTPPVTLFILTTGIPFIGLIYLIDYLFCQFYAYKYMKIPYFKEPCEIKSLDNGFEISSSRGSGRYLWEDFKTFYTHKYGTLLSLKSNINLIIPKAGFDESAYQNFCLALKDNIKK